MSEPRRYENIGNLVFPPDAVDLLLIRHGQSESWAEGEEVPTVEGHGDPPLSETGHAQAAALAARLPAEGVSAIYTSDLIRTQQTAAPLAARLSLVPTVVPDLREVFLGDWEGGRYRVMVAERAPQFLEHIRSGHWSVIPGAEDDTAFRGRVMQALNEIIAAHTGKRVVVVTHSGVISAVLAEAFGTDRSLLLHVDQTSITQLVALRSILVVRRVNDARHLGDPFSESLIEGPASDT